MKKIAFILGILLFSSSLSIAQQKMNPGLKLVNQNAPVITFDKVIHNYGTIEYKSDAECVFKFKNTGKEPLILSKPRLNCGCAASSWPKQPIMPGQRGEICIKYDSKRVGRIKKTVTVRSNAKNKTVVLQLRGVVNKKSKIKINQKKTN
jgi:hypothetical protein